MLTSDKIRQEVGFFYPTKTNAFQQWQRCSLDSSFLSQCVTCCEAVSWPDCWTWKTSDWCKHHQHGKNIRFATFFPWSLKKAPLCFLYELFWLFLPWYTLTLYLKMYREILYTKLKCRVNDYYHFKQWYIPKN